MVTEDARIDLGPAAPAANGPALAKPAVHDRVHAQLIFGLAFAYTTLATLVIQLVVLPYLVPSLHAGHGLMVGHDSVGFHAMADEMATRIQASGWHEWTFAPDLQRTVGILAAVYAITGVHEPAIVTPLYALLYAIGTLCIYRTTCLLSGSRAGGWCAALAFLLFPSAATIYADMHKDAFSAAGLLLLIGAWSEYETRERIGLWRIVWFLATCALAVLLLWLVRPYLVKLSLGALSVGLIAMLTAKLVLTRGRRFDPRAYLPHLAVLAVMAAITTYSSAPLMNAAPPPASTPAMGGPAAPAKAAEASSLDRLFDRTFGSILYVRSGFAMTKGGSRIDKDVRITSFSDLAAYLPRTMQIGLFAPFPDTWFERGMTAGAHMMRLVSGLEMTICYVLFAGYLFLVLALKRNRVVPFVFVMATCLTLLCVVSLAVPNVGTLYRMRYPFFMLIVGLGAAGWALYLTRTRPLKGPSPAPAD